MDEPPSYRASLKGTPGYGTNTAAFAPSGIPGTTRQSVEYGSNLLPSEHMSHYSHDQNEFWSDAVTVDSQSTWVPPYDESQYLGLSPGKRTEAVNKTRGIGI